MQLARKITDSPELQVAIVDPPRLPAEPGLEEMFCDVYRRIHDRALDHAERFLSSSEAADAIADAIAEIWLKWKRLTPDQRSDAYFFGCIHYHVLLRLRQNASAVHLEDAEAELARLAINEIDTPSRTTTAADVIDLAVASMPPRRREVFVLVREQHFTYQEAAALLGVSLGTVNTHMRLAADDLRAAFTDRGFRIAGNVQALLQSETPEGSHE
jgi:RNA polymerase sigma-70 factor (ECF subfamily)